MEPRKLLLLSSSIIYENQKYLEYASVYINNFLKKYNVNKIAFIPYALQDHNAYEEKVKNVFNKLGFNLKSIHHYQTPKSQEKALYDADAIYIGGGNTFLLLKTLYEQKLIKPIRHCVLINGKPYIGVSAGTNVATLNICTTNDMPIVYPPSFNALSLVPFNINPHYIEMSKGINKHMGETRDERIEQYLKLPNIPPVVGLREGSILEIEGDAIKVLGVANIRLFKANNAPVEYSVGTDISFLMENTNLMNPCAIATPVDDQDGDQRWMSIHNRFLHETREKDPDVIFIGDSILQALQHTDVWNELFAPLHCLNFSIHRDKTQNVLWRIKNGELDNVKPKAVVLHVGTNNLTNTPEEVAEGIFTIVNEIQSKHPDAYIVLPSLLPRGQYPNSLREHLVKINEIVKQKAQTLPRVETVDIDKGFVQPDGTISHHDMHDYLLLTNTGSRKAFEPVYELLLQLLSEGEVEKDLTPSE